MSTEVVPDSLDGGFVATCPELAGAVAQGETEHEARCNLAADVIERLGFGHLGECIAVVILDHAHEPTDAIEPNVAELVHEVLNFDQWTPSGTPPRPEAGDDDRVTYGDDDSDEVDEVIHTGIAHLEMLDDAPACLRLHRIDDDVTFTQVEIRAEVDNHGNPRLVIAVAEDELGLGP